MSPDLVPHLIQSITFFTHPFTSSQRHPFVRMSVYVPGCRLPCNTNAFQVVRTLVEFAQGNEGNKLAIATPSLSICINDLFWERCVLRDGHGVTKHFQRGSFPRIPPSMQLAFVVAFFSFSAPSATPTPLPPPRAFVSAAHLPIIVDVALTADWLGAAGFMSTARAGSTAVKGSTAAGGTATRRRRRTAGGTAERPRPG